jgi:hypothetical protein
MKKIIMFLLLNSAISAFAENNLCHLDVANNVSAFIYNSSNEIYKNLTTLKNTDLVNTYSCSGNEVDACVKVRKSNSNDFVEVVAGKNYTNSVSMYNGWLPTAQNIEEQKRIGIDQIVFNKELGVYVGILTQKVLSYHFYSNEDNGMTFSNNNNIISAVYDVTSVGTPYVYSYYEYLHLDKTSLNLNLNIDGTKKIEKLNCIKLN